MKKLMTIMLGLSLLGGTVATVMAQDAPKTEKKAKAKSTKAPKATKEKKAKAKKTEAPK